MPDYKTMYFNLAASVADAIELLQTAQQQGEEAYIDAAGALPPLSLAPKRPKTKGAKRRDEEPAAPKK